MVRLLSLLIFIHSDFDNQGKENEKEGFKMTVKERILSIQLAEKIKNRVEYANRIGVEAKTVRKKSK